MIYFMIYFMYQVTFVRLESIRQLEIFVRTTLRVYLLKNVPPPVIPCHSSEVRFPTLLMKSPSHVSSEY